MSPLEFILLQAVQREGVLSFARFMETALYTPAHGYYERHPTTLGVAGDYYTSVSSGPAFGRLLAARFARWLESTPHHALQLLEAGAHDGRLAADILTWLQARHPALLERLEYWILEPSVTRRAWQETCLKAFPGQVRWLDSIAALAHGSVCGVIFSNEFLDALPVHRLRWDAAARAWREWGVTFCQGRFDWAPLPPQNWSEVLAAAGLEIPPELGAVLPNGFTIDLCPAAGHWWSQAARSLQEGWLLTIDYGWTAPEFLAPERGRGTLRAYHRHHATDDLLARPGEQDLTAHVHFTQLERAGEAAGLRTEGLFTQEQFLTRIVQALLEEDPGRTDLGPWRTLVHPEHLGRPFRVLVQSRRSANACGASHGRKENSGSPEPE